MKTTSLIFLLILAVQVNANPQKERRNDLNLTEEQKTQMQAVKQNQNEKLMAAREVIMAESQVEMAQFLTPDQMAKVEQMHQHRKAHMDSKKGHRKMKRKDRREDKNSD